jgi:hypothetical protein
VQAEKLLNLLPLSGYCVSMVCNERTAHFDPLYDGRAYIHRTPILLELKLRRTGNSIAVVSSVQLRCALSKRTITRMRTVPNGFFAHYQGLYRVYTGVKQGWKPWLSPVNPQ